MAAVSRAWLSRGAATEAIPGVSLSVVVNRARPPVSPADGRLTASWRGPLKPGPKPAASRSYAWRVVWLVGSLPESLAPSRRPRAGEAKASSRAVDPAPAHTGPR